MKNPRIYLAIITMAMLFVACDETESPVFDPNGGQTLAFFNSSSSNLEVEIDATGKDTIPVGFTTLADQDRTITVAVVDSLTSANPENYTFQNKNVVVPAGEYLGNLIIEGVDNSVETQPELLTLKLESMSVDGILSQGMHTVSVLQVCPIPSDYLVGSYLVEDDVATVGPENSTTNFEPMVVNVSIGASPTQRTFDANLLPGVIDAGVTINMAMVCGEIVLAQDVDPNVTCDGGENGYVYTSAANGGYSSSTYDLNSDDVIIVNYTEDIEGSCGGPHLASFKLTKQ